MKNCDKLHLDEDNGINMVDCVNSKTVRFNDSVKVFVLDDFYEDYVYYRKKFWEYYAVDRIRFKDRIKLLENILNPVLENTHRCKMYNKYFN